MPQKLLLADDSVTIQRVIELTFADEDVQVIAVGDGRQAIDRIAAERPDIVLADVGMPGCDGYEVASYVKNAPDLAHIPVLLLTGAFEPVDEARAQAAHCDGVLAKPFEPQHLIARVKELLGGRGTAGHVAETAPDFGTAAPSSPPATPPAEAAPTEPPPAAAVLSDLDLGGSVKPVPAASLDDYFDRLDAAFANLAENPPPPLEEMPVADLDLEPRWGPGGLGAALGDSGDSVRPSSAGETEGERPQAPAAPPEIPISEVFGALLAAERGGPAPSMPAPPSAQGAFSAGAPPSDELVEQVCQRVIERMTDRAVREVVSEIVSGVAERLVREEVERLKALIK
jgi:CheY-like chemotaxis protein